ncbi:MAG: outer membrane protein assembly factor BamB [Xanthomonadales bacterium]|nr:outer membrane protein assembly factor BamB [Xanthomonadales bacterium]
MKRIALTLLLTGLLISVSGCSWFSKAKPGEPAELVNFDASLKVKKIWSTNIGKGNSQKGLNLKPAYDNGRVYASDHRGRVIAVDAENGKKIWEIETELPVSAGPAIANDFLFLGTLEAEVYAYSNEDGSFRWNARVSSEVLAMPVLHDGIVIVRCLDGRVFGLDADTGDRVWVYDSSVPLLTIRGNSTPVVRAGVAYVGYDSGELIAIRVADGAVGWTTQIAAAEGRSELDRLVDIDGNIAMVATDIYVASYKNRMGALASESGRLLWFKDIGTSSGIAVDRTHLAVSDSLGHLWMLDRRNGAEDWKLEMLENRQLTLPAFYDSFVVVGDMEGYLHWFKVETGELVARNKVAKGGFASSPLVIGTTMYVFANNGDLIAYRAGPAI